MNKKTNHRIVRRVFALVLAMTMVASLFAIRISAATADFEAPESAMTVNKNLITVSAHSQAFLLPEIIGLTNTTSRNMELPDVFATNAGDTQTAISLNEAKKTAILGVFGSNINENPNPYMYNYFYNAWATENEATLAPVGDYTMSTGIGNMFSPSNAANEGGITDASGMTVPVSIYLNQDILLGCNPRSGSRTGYTDVIAAYNQAKGTNYAPYQVDYEMSHVYSFLQNLYAMSDIAHEINQKNGKTWRYTDPEVISGDVEKYVKGLEAYVLKKLEEDNKAMQVVAVVDTSYTSRMRKAGTIKNNEWVLNTKDCSTQQTTLYSRVAEFAADTTTNLVDKLGLTEADLIKTPADRGNFVNNFYKVTSDQIADNADLVLFTDVTMATTNEAGDRKVDEFKQDLSNTLVNKSLVDKVEDLEMMTSAFDCVGSIGANSVENLLGMAYFTAYIYPEYLDQFAVAAYWYNNFYHISNMGKLRSTMSSNFATSSVRKGYESRNARNIAYNKADVEALAVEGMKYYDANKEKFQDKLIYQNGQTGENTGWDIDWTQGIGAEQKPCTSGGAHTYETIPGKAADCTNAGLTDGLRCSVCGEILKPQREIKAKGHAYNKLVEKGKAATCTEDGTTDKVQCAICGDVLDHQPIKATGHKYVKTEAKAATCTDTGLTEGEKCSVCGDVKTAQEVVPALGHDFKDGKCTRCEAADPNVKPTPTPTPAPKQNGLADSADSNGDWWFYKDGKIDTTHNGVDQNKYGWWRVENGKVNFNAQSIYQNQFGWWKTTNGKVTFKEEGVFQNGFGWWRVKDSKVDFNAQSIYQNKFGWWKTTNGKVTFKENGLFSNQYGTWKVENSKVNFNFNGKYQGKTIKNGKVV